MSNEDKVGNLVTAARHDLTLVGDDGAMMLQLSPLADQDITELTAYVSQKYMAAVRVAIAMENRQSARDEIIAVALRTVATMQAFSALGVKILSTEEGMSRVLYQQCARNNPDVTQEKIRLRLKNADNLRAANAAFIESNSNPLTGLKKS